MTETNGGNEMLPRQTIENFEQISEFVFVPNSESEYDRILELLDEITDIVRDDEKHPLANLMDVLGVLIENYENRFIPEPVSKPADVLRHFMKEHGLESEDLPELGSQEAALDILNGTKELNLRQIRELSRRFNVPASVFI
ncbi:helix-turn-helix domain-containing protein [Desulfonema magnum]|nr:transcriptional regulator [Desulfonema magnum]